MKARRDGFRMNRGRLAEKLAERLATQRSREPGRLTFQMRSFGREKSSWSIDRRDGGA